MGPLVDGGCFDLDLSRFSLLPSKSEPEPTHLDPWEITAINKLKRSLDLVCEENTQDNWILVAEAIKKLKEAHHRSLHSAFLLKLADTEVHDVRSKASELLEHLDTWTSL